VFISTIDRHLLENILRNTSRGRCIKNYHHTIWYLRDTFFS